MKSDEKRTKWFQSLSWKEWLDSQQNYRHKQSFQPQRPGQPNGNKSTKTSPSKYPHQPINKNNNDNITTDVRLVVMLPSRSGIRQSRVLPVMHVAKHVFSLSVRLEMDAGELGCRGSQGYGLEFNAPYKFDWSHAFVPCHIRCQNNLSYIALRHVSHFLLLVDW